MLIDFYRLSVAHFCLSITCLLIFGCRVLALHCVFINFHQCVVFSLICVSYVLFVSQFTANCMLVGSIKIDSYNTSNDDGLSHSMQQLKKTFLFSILGTCPVVKTAEDNVNILVFTVLHFILVHFFWFIVLLSSFVVVYCVD